MISISDSHQAMRVNELLKTTLFRILLHSAIKGTLKLWELILLIIADDAQLNYIPKRVSAMLKIDRNVMHGVHQIKVLSRRYFAAQIACPQNRMTNDFKKRVGTVWRNRIISDCLLHNYCQISSLGAVQSSGNRSFTAIAQPGTAGSASAVSPGR